MSMPGVFRTHSPGDLTPIIAAISAGLSAEDRAPDLPGIFERELQRALAIRSVRLREIPPRYRARLVTPTRTADSIVLGVPTADPRVQAVLEAFSGPDRVLGSADHEMLAVAAQLATSLARRGGSAHRSERGDASAA